MSPAASFWLWRSGRNDFWRSFRTQKSNVTGEPLPPDKNLAMRTCRVRSGIIHRGIWHTSPLSVKAGKPREGNNASKKCSPSDPETNGIEETNLYDSRSPARDELLYNIPMGFGSGKPVDGAANDGNNKAGPRRLEYPEMGRGGSDNVFSECDGQGQCSGGERANTVGETGNRIAMLFKMLKDRFRVHITQRNAAELCGGPVA